MSAELVGRFEDESPEWYDARVGCLGGSEIASVVGLSPWTSRYTLWHRKAGHLDEQRETTGMNWGKRLEGAIAERWCEDYPELVPLPGGTFRSIDRPWQIANPDLLVARSIDGEPEALLEVKTASAFVSHEWGKDGAGPEGVPPYYRVQTEWYLDVFDLPVAYLAVLLGGSDYRCFEIPADAQRAQWLRDAGAEFMESVASGVAPKLDGSESTYEAVRELHPDIDSAAEVDLPGDMWVRYCDLEQAQKDATTAHTQAKSELMDHMGAARYGLFLGEKVVRREARGQGNPYLKVIPKPKENAA